MDRAIWFIFEKPTNLAYKSTRCDTNMCICRKFTSFILWIVYNYIQINARDTCFFPHVSIYPADVEETRPLPLASGQQTIRPSHTVKARGSAVTRRGVQKMLMTEPVDITSKSSGHDCRPGLDGEKCMELTTAVNPQCKNILLVVLSLVKCFCLSSEVE